MNGVIPMRLGVTVAAHHTLVTPAAISRPDDKHSTAGAGSSGGSSERVHATSARLAVTMPPSRGVFPRP
jgi:hypothetical protein